MGAVVKFGQNVFNLRRIGLAAVGGVSKLRVSFVAPQ